MAEHEQRDPGPRGEGEEAGPRSGDEDPGSEGTVDRVVNDVKDGVDRVAEKVKDLLRSNR